MSDELLVEYLLGEISLQEQILVEEWINSDEVHQRYFEHFRLIWEKSKVLAAVSTVDENAAWKRFQQRINGEAQTQAPVIPIKKKFNPLKMVAVVASIVIVAGLYYLWS